MRAVSKYAIALVLTALLAGCKVTLYSNVGEAEANEMLALLMLRKIPAEKVQDKGGLVTLRVDQDMFVNAVEVLRQNGLPQNKRVGMEDLFPSNQLVTSPAQERAKMLLLKEQQIEGMIAAMDGVIGARVSIAQKVDENGKPTGKPSAAVFVKYSPQFNMGAYEMQIRSLVADGVPDIAPSEISVVTQAADYRYEEQKHADPAPAWQKWIETQPEQAAGLAMSIVLGLAAVTGLGLFLRRKEPRHA